MLLVAASATVVVIGIALALPRLADADSPATPPADSPASAPTPAPAASTPAEQLLAGTDDANACAVTFSIDGAEVDPVLVSQGALYGALPIPRRDDAVFAGWYATATDATAYTTAARVNGSELATCADRQQTLYGSWMTHERVAAEDAAIPILMYHQFTTNPEGEDDWLRLNYAYIGDFEAHMDYLATDGFYLPTWDELSAFIDGALFLPDRSVIITDDDAHHTWLELAAPIVEAKGLLATSFVITKFRSEPAPNPYVLQRSHTHDMHEAGADGQGRIVNWSPEQIAADMTASAQILGAAEVVAYPFGHYNGTAKEGLRLAGFEMARTIEQGYVRAGTDKLALPCIRIDYGMTVDDLRRLVG
ncbi:polysaccharide deacetylase family protein [Microbacterium sp. zg.Y625]|uniref:polysaccharide deacetylase family protein n=1 Tax=Microbacterium jiangjiandongii TaxID=3049071 RepID=UPI00214CD84E|nr:MULTISPECIES: polysaccharide deacetylase family protein [unclassified Microbacterium]MCR2794320.1 polysaccharide deacetylase family protein [Microbacterium sp. zg.Y625]WIM25633.1 polysaccharide deacetylase family protein [Microbacterium sp. zg-Y625]